MRFSRKDDEVLPPDARLRSVISSGGLSHGHEQHMYHSNLGAWQYPLFCGRAVGSIVVEVQ